MDYVISTAAEEKALLGKIGERFDTPEKIALLDHFRYQEGLANYLMFCELLSLEKLAQVAEIVGYEKPAVRKVYPTGQETLTASP